MTFCPEEYYNADLSPEEWRGKCLEIAYALEQEKIRAILLQGRNTDLENKLYSLSRQSTQNEGVDVKRVIEILRGSPPVSPDMSHLLTSTRPELPETSHDSPNSNR